MKHGHARRNNRTRTFRSWEAMLQRCYNSATERYERWGGRGISVCDRWMKFENFLADMGEAPAGLTLDRINNDGNYEPANCRWASVAEQSRNSSAVHIITFRGVSKTVGDWAKAIGIGQSALSQRLRRGWSVEKSLTSRHRWKSKQSAGNAQGWL